ncbi:MAG: hypothetical protein DRO96_01310 [Candidatus Aenigmatarchaeota archaeon]|nr:MAG: hypothetical protein B6U68_02250 [Candidatus Aenigmarchaeota archaeon ex4484_14]RLI97158.1 MAG: hypothetical protein DRO96_01310 [Candidatus Aenigmarchaeota archaeon]
MRARFYEGFTVYENGVGPVYVVLHGGPALGAFAYRDETAETVGSFLVEKGGTLIISNMARNRIYGIDMNRLPPPKAKALGMYKIFLDKPFSANAREYRKKYAWVAIDEREHEKKKKIYERFWHTTKSYGNFFVLLHRKFSLLKNYPSIMDLSTFDSKGIDRNTLKIIVDKINERYKTFFEKLRVPFMTEVLSKEKQILIEAKLEKEKLDVKKLKDKYQWTLAEELKMIKNYAPPHVFDRVRSKFTISRYMRAARIAAERCGPPLVTVERFFKGKLSYGPKKFLVHPNNIVVQVELDAFFNKYYPDETSNIMFEIITSIKMAELYKKIGFSQKNIKEFL